MLISHNLFEDLSIKTFLVVSFQSGADARTQGTGARTDGTCFFITSLLRGIKGHAHALISFHFLSDFPMDIERFVFTGNKVGNQLTVKMF